MEDDLDAILSNPVPLTIPKLLCGESVSAEQRPLTEPLSIPQMIRECTRKSGERIRTGESQMNQREYLSQYHVSTKNPTWTDLGPKMGPCFEKLETNHLSYGTAYAPRTE
jgi:hypothetical protein